MKVKQIWMIMWMLTVDVEQIVEQTMKEANPKRPGYISYDE